LSINPDAHSIRELDLVRWGIAIARKGGLAKKNVLHTRMLSDLLRYFQAKRLSRTVTKGRNKRAMPAVPSQSRKRNERRER